MLIRLFAIPSAFLAIALIAATATAQHQTYPTAQYSVDSYHRYTSHPPNVVHLDQWADQLAKAAKHLHEDAHELGQDYEHSQGIEASVDRLDHLNEHMHNILHVAADRHYLTQSEIQHIAKDLRDVRKLAIDLDRDLEHQRHDGARTHDFHSLNHMRQILSHEVFPLVRKMEYELGYRSTSHHRLHHGHTTYPVSRYGHR